MQIFAVFAGSYDHIAAAFFAFFRRNDLIKRFYILARRVIGAGEKLSVPAVFIHHGRSALIADFVRTFDVERFYRLTFGADEIFAVSAAALDHIRFAALSADDIRLFVVVARGDVEFFYEMRIEAFEYALPGIVAVFDSVEAIFHIRRERYVHYVGEIFHEGVRHFERDGGRL